MLRTCYYIWWYFVHITACKTLKFLVCKKLHIMKLFMHGKIKKVTPGFNLKVWKNHRTIYSETTFLESCRKVVREKWFFILGFFFWSTTFLEPEKMWIYGKKPPFFLVNHFSRTRFLEPDFSNQISRTTFLHFSRKEVAE